MYPSFTHHVPIIYPSFTHHLPMKTGDWPFKNPTSFPRSSISCVSCPAVSTPDLHKDGLEVPAGCGLRRSGAVAKKWWSQGLPRKHMETSGKIMKSSGKVKILKIYFAWFSGWWWLEHEWMIFHFIYGMSSFPLTNSYFSRWLKPPTSHDISIYIYIYFLWEKMESSPRSSFLPAEKQKNTRICWTRRPEKKTCGLDKHRGCGLENSGIHPQTWGGLRL